MRSMTFQLLMLLCKLVAGGAQRAGRGQNQDTYDQNWPKGCPMPCGIMLNNTTWKDGGGGDGRGGCCCCFGTSWASVSRDLTTALCLTCFVYHLLLSLPFLFTIKLSIYQPMSFTYSPVLSSITMGDST